MVVIIGRREAVGKLQGLQEKSNAKGTLLFGTGSFYPFIQYP
jgi:hypothetical protein